VKSISIRKKQIPGTIHSFLNLLPFDDMTKSGPRLTTVVIRPNYLPGRFLMTPAQRDISRKLRIFNDAKQIGNVSAACRHFGISREIYYRSLH
jgi:hypothetical protein